VLASIGYAAAYTGVGILLLVLGAVVLDLLTPGHLARHIYEERSVNAGIALGAVFLGQGAIAFTTIWTNGTSGFGDALADTVVFGLVGIALQVVAFLVLDVLTPGKLGHMLVEVPFHPASLVSAASTLAVSAIVVASIWP
jgi:uncharacterized membrane protein YjfL (UPF0719 family)